MNLLDLVKDQVSGSLASSAASFLGESEEGVTKALGGIFPALLGKALSTADGGGDGLSKLFDMAKGADDSILDDIGGLFGGGAGNVAKLMNNGSGVLNLLLGNSTGGIIDKLAGFSGLKGSATSSLIKMAAPFLMSIIGRHIKNKALDAVGLGKLLGDQRGFLKSAMPGNLLDALGGNFLSKGADIVTGLASDGLGAGKKVVGDAANVAGDAAKKAANVAGAAGEVAAKTGGSVLKWALPLLIALAALSFFGVKTCNPVDKAADMTKAAVEKTAEVAGDAAKATANAAGDAAKAAASAVGAVFGKVDEAAKAALDKITFAAGSAGNQMMEFITGGFEGDARFRFNNLTFNTGSAEITAETAPEVDNIAAILKAYPGVTGTVEGYTDNTGDAAKNVQLSQARANAVKARLIAQGITPERIMTKGFGDANPVGDNATEEGRAQNRRIEFVINK